MRHAKRRIRPPALEGGSSEVVALIDNYFNAYNSARLREACEILVRMIESGTTIGVSLSGALTPAGLSSVLVPLIKRGYIDYISSTGANLYHDLHFDLDEPLYRSTAEVASGAFDVQLRKDGVIRVYDVLFDAETLYRTDEWVYRVLMEPEFRGKRMSGSELHHRLGRYALETARKLNVQKPSLLAICHELDVPVWVPSPGDSTIGLNLAAIYAASPNRPPQVDPAADVTEMAAVVHDAKSTGGSSGVLIFGGGAPKNFLLQTEPQLQEIMGIAEKGHDYFIQFTDARPDTGGLSGATPQEAVSWGKVDPDRLPDTAVCYADSTIVMPLLASYVMAKCPPREPKRLYRRLPELVTTVCDEYRKTDIYKRYWGTQNPDE